MEVEWPIITYRFTKRMSRGEENEGGDPETHEDDIPLLHPYEVCPHAMPPIFQQLLAAFSNTTKLFLLSDKCTSDIIYTL